jgi:hypothetical protein
MEPVRPTFGELPVLPQELAGDVQDGFDVEVAVSLPELEEVNVLRVAEQPGGFVVERSGAVLELADAQRDPEALALAAKAPARGRRERCDRSVGARVERRCHGD